MLFLTMKSISRKRVSVAVVISVAIQMQPVFAQASLAAESNGNLNFAAPSKSHGRTVDASTGARSVFATAGASSYTAEGAGAAATPNRPLSLAVESHAYTFIADKSNNMVREVAALSGKSSTVAGIGVKEFSGDGGSASLAELAPPPSVGLDTTKPNVIVKEDPGLNCGVSGSVSAGGTATMTGSSGNGTSSIFFSVNGSTVASCAPGSAGQCSASFQAPTTAGSYSASCTQPGTGIYTAASYAFTLVVGPPAMTTPSVSVSCIPNPMAYGQNTTCTALVSGGATGTVTWYANGSGWTTLPVGTPAVGWAGWAPGTYPVGATYNGDSSHYSASGSTSITIQTATPSLSASCNPNTITYGSQTSTCTASLSGGTGSYTGTLQTYWDGNAWCSGVPTATCTGWNGQPAGTHTFSASYSGDSGNSSVNNSTTLPIAKAIPSISISCSPNPIVFGGGNTTCTATVTSGATGSVSFTANNGAWTTVALSGNTASATGWGGGSWPPGTYPVGATYNGDGNFYSGSNGTTITIAKATANVSVSCSPNPITYGGGNTTCTATVTNGATGNVAFTANGGGWTTVGLSGNTASATGWGGGSWAAGTYPVGVTYNGDGNYTSAVASTTVTINKTTPSISLFCSPNPLTYGAANNTTCTTNVGGGATGTIAWTADGGVWGTTTLSGGSTSASGWAVWPAGAHTVGVTYSGDGNFNSVTTSIPLTIAPAPQTINFPAPQSPVIYGVSPITLSAPASSGLSATFSVVSGPGSIPPGSNVLTITGVGTVVVAANQAGNSNYLAAAQVTQSVVVNPATPTITLNPSQNPTCPYPCVTQYTATIVNGPSTGSVTFYDGGTTSIGSGTISGGFATMTSSLLKVGVHSITAVWPGNADYSSATSSVLTETITTQVPQISWPTPAPITYGTALSSAQLNASASASVQTNYSGTKTTTSVAGPFTYTPGSGTVLSGGSQTLTAAFAPTDSTDYLSTTATVPITVNPFPTTLTATTSGATSSYGASVTFTATISSPPAGASAPTGAVTFYDGASSIGTGAISGTTATLTTSTLAVGAHTITAGWVGSANYSAVTSGAITQTVNLATPTLSVATSTTQSVYGGSVTFTATISNGLTGPVIFYDGSTTQIGSASVSGTTAKLTTTTLTAGTHSITAKWAGNTDYKGVTSSAITQTVAKATPTLSLATSLTPSIFGGSVTFTATISSGPAGTITFLDGGSSIGTGTISGKTATFGTTSLAGGVHSLTASWAGNTNYNAATSIAISQTVNPAATTLSVVSSGTPSTYGGSVTFTAIISNGPTGTVTFYDKGLSIGTGTISNTTATLTTSTLTAGTHAITAGWAGNGNYKAATSSAITQTVNKAPGPPINWTAPAAITYGTALSGTQLNATTSMPGNFTYYPGPGAVPDVGTQTLWVTFEPTNTSFNSSTAWVPLVVNMDPSSQLTPTISWVTPAAISYGTPLSSTQLNASASYGGTNVPGIFEYTPATGEVLDAGSQALTVLFFPTDSVHYTTASGRVLLQVNASSSIQPLTIYSYNITGTNGTSGYDAAGNVIGYADSVMGSWSMATGYDTLNRLTSARNMATTQTSLQYAGMNLCWAYDSFGNRTVQSLQSSACPAQSTSTWKYGSNNQVSGVFAPGSTQASPPPVTYDAAGDVISDTGSGNQYLYDGEGRICAVSSPSPLGGFVMTGYIYDAEGNRVSKGQLASWPSNGLCPNFSATGVFTPTNYYVLGPSNEQLTEIDGHGNWLHTNVWAAGSLIATYDTASAGVPTLHFSLSDWLGTRRVQTDPNGNVEANFTSLPFGDGFISSIPSGAQATADDSTEHHFTGKERDTESGNDYFGARYYSSSMGRFMSPDWSAKEEPVPYAKLDNPQTLNLYAYVGNNPLSGFDPDGHTVDICINTSETFCSITPDPKDKINGSQQQMGDPTLPTEVQEPFFNKAMIAEAKDGGIQLAFLVGTEGIGELAEVGTALFRGLELSTKLGAEGISGAEKVAKITEEADKFYPSKVGKIQAHHEMPQALGGPKGGPTTDIPASYHQLITNMTRTLTKNYTDFSAGANAIMDKVYSYFPIHW